METLEFLIKEKTRRDFEKRKIEKEEDVEKLKNLVQTKNIFKVNEIKTPQRQIIQQQPKPEQKMFQHSPMDIHTQPIPLTNIQNLPAPVPLRKMTQQSPIPRRMLPGFITKELRIHTPPEPLSPEVRPSPTNVQIDLGKLNILISDPTVISIECNGPNTNLIIKRPKERRVTEMMLTSEEINEIIQKFSQMSKIPVQEGVFRVAVGKLVISSTISDNPKFIITKMFAY